MFVHRLPHPVWRSACFSSTLLKSCNVLNGSIRFWLRSIRHHCVTHCLSSLALLSQLHVSVLLVDDGDNIPKLWQMQREQFLSALAQRIKELRKKRGFSQEAF